MGADPISGMFQGAGTYFGAKAQADAARDQAKINQETSREQIKEQGREFDVTSKFQQETEEARKKAYNEAITRAGGQMQEGESAFLDAADTASPELAGIKADILKGNAESINQANAQLEADLAQSGVRGGQAATQLRHNAAQMSEQAQRDINQLIGSEAMQREAEKRAYLAAKAKAGQAGTLPGTGVSF